MGFGAEFHLPAFNQLAGVEITALADNGSGKAAMCAATLPSVPVAYSSGTELIKKSNVDLVSISAPPQYHMPLVMAAIDAGKDVLCEKPFGLSFSESKLMFQASCDRGIKTAIGFEMRYDIGIAALARMIHAGQIGNVESIQVRWLTSGGANSDRLYSWRDDQTKSLGIISEFGTHVIDYAQWIVQSSVLCVDARAETIIKQRPSQNDVMKTVTVPDSLHIKCDFENGVSGDFYISNACFDSLGHKIEVRGEKGSLRLELNPPYREIDIELYLIDRDGQASPVNAMQNSVNMDEDTRTGAFNVLVDDFVNKHTFCWI